MAEESNALPSRFAVFSTKDGNPSVVARFENDDVWLTQKHLAELFNTTKQLISHHLKNIFDSGELSHERSVKGFLTIDEKCGLVAKRAVMHYNLDAIIALGYRIDSPIAIRQLKRLRANILTDKGKVSHEEAMAKAESEFEIYRAREMRQLKSDFDKTVQGYLNMGEK